MKTKPNSRISPVSAQLQLQTEELPFDRLLPSAHQNSENSEQILLIEIKDDARTSSLNQLSSSPFRRRSSLSPAESHPPKPQISQVLY